jgi:hypothetical protein
MNYSIVVKNIIGAKMPTSADLNILYDVITFVILNLNGERPKAFLKVLKIFQGAEK